MFRDVAYAALSAIVGVGLAAACSANNSDPSTVGAPNTTGGSSSGGSAQGGGGQGGSGQGGSSQGGSSQGGSSQGGSSQGGSFQFDAAADAEESDASCSTVRQQAINAVDIIWVIDNSCSMGDEIDKVRTNLNDSFVPIIQTSTIDWQVVMFSKRGTGSLDVCVDQPLAGPGCSDNAPRFRHLPCEVGSSDSLSRLKNTYLATGPCGWGQALRYHSTKVFIEVTDDEAGLPPPFGSANPGADFDFFLTDQSDPPGVVNPPGVFGTQGDRKYVFHSIVGADPNNLAETCESPSCTTDPDAGTCNRAVAPGLQYQAISNATGGLVRSICEDDWSDIFNKIAQGIVDTLTCEYTPVPPAGETIDPDKVNVTYTPGDGSAEEEILQDTNAGCADGADGWQWNDSKTKIILCGPTCDRVSSDPNAAIDIELGCETKQRPPPA